jgi:hypothetical protein
MGAPVGSKNLQGHKPKGRHSTVFQQRDLVQTLVKVPREVCGTRGRLWTPYLLHSTLSLIPYYCTNVPQHLSFTLQEGRLDD